MTRRRLTAEETKLWQAAMRGVRRFHAAGLPPAAQAPAPAPAVPRPIPPAVDRLAGWTPDLKAAAVAAPARDFDRTVEQRIRTGQARIEARLDLHGMTEARAYQALCGFILASAAAQRRVVLVVTGKGADGRGVLKHNLPRWLEAPPLEQHVAASRPAFDRHGGAGAVYLHLRRHRNKVTAR